MTPFDRSHAASYSTSIVTMAVSCVIFELQRDIGRKTPIFAARRYANAAIAVVGMSVCPPVCHTRGLCQNG